MKRDITEDCLASAASLDPESAPVTRLEAVPKPLRIVEAVIVLTGEPLPGNFKRSADIVDSDGGAAVQLTSSNWASLSIGCSARNASTHQRALLMPKRRTKRDGTTPN